MKKLSLTLFFIGLYVTLSSYTSVIRAAATSAIERRRLSSALLRAAEQCNEKKAVRLIAAGANVHAKHPWTKETPLHYAAKNGCLELVDVLLEKKAHVDAIAEHGSVLHYALGQQKKPSLALVIVSRLIHAGADVNAKNSWGTFFPLILCLYKIEHRFALPIAFRLLAAGAQKDQRNALHETTLQVAKNFGRYDMVALLEMYPGRTLQERIIFDLAKRFYSNDLRERIFSEKQLEQLQEEGFAQQYPDLNRMLYLIVGKDIRGSTPTVTE